MARIPTLKDRRNATISIEKELHRSAVQKAKTLRIGGGFSEYVARLIARDQRRKGSAALGTSRHLSKGKAATVEAAK